MTFYKKWWFWLIIILILLGIFLFPKSCGGGGGIGGPWTSVDCSCVGFTKIVSYSDAVENKCFGICLENTCKTTVSNP